MVEALGLVAAIMATAALMVAALVGHRVVMATRHRHEWKPRPEIQMAAAGRLAQVVQVTEGPVTVKVTGQLPVVLAPGQVALVTVGELGQATAVTVVEAGKAAAVSASKTAASPEMESTNERHS